MNFGENIVRTPHRRIRKKLEAGDRVVGATIQLACPENVEIAGWAGMDFVWIDAEHGTMDLGDINQLIRAADASGIDAIVRVPDQNPSFIQRVLDAGAAGIIVPHVRNLENARAIVKAAKFEPEGNRGACPSTRSMGHLTFNWAADYRSANRDVLVFGLIEDVDGVDNIESITSESGLDGILFGPFDLAQSSGLEGDVRHSQIKAMHDKVVAAVRKSGIEYISILAWGFGDLAEIGSYSNIFSISGDRGGLFVAFHAACAEFAEAAKQSGMVRQS